jgi:heme oxygenase
MRRPRHAYLRDTTKAAHDALERAVESAGFFDGVAAYGNYLRRMRLLHLSLERSLGSASGEWLGRWGLADHASWLDDDLYALSIAALPASAARGFRKPKCDDDAARLGAFYVMLGATLGARLLVRRIDSLTLPPAQGRTYLTALSRCNDWPGYLEALEAEPLSSEPGIGAGAVAAFESVLDHMSGAIVV